MKELSIKEKAKRYDDALERAQKELQTCGSTDCDAAKQIFRLFPELKEPKDERIRKELTEFLKSASGGFLDTTTQCKTFGKWVAWLEKQGEQKLSDKIEQKFHEGEWLCENEHNNYARFIQILETVNVQGKERYRISRDIHNDEDVVEVDFVEKYYHKFDIKDAKDGEVLATPNYIYIFNSIDKETETVAFYCLIKKSDKHFSFGDYRIQDEILNSTPATKKQYDTLLKAMADARYEWDSEKKELKKIHVIDEGKAEMDYCFTKMMNGEKVSSTWSEEDEVKINRIVACLENLNVADNDILLKDVNWLKSLKERYIWKPSDEQMDALAWALSLAKNCGEENAFDLRTLYEQLKKLKGE